MKTIKKILRFCCAAPVALPLLLLAWLLTVMVPTGIWHYRFSAAGLAALWLLGIDGEVQ